MLQITPDHSTSLKVREGRCPANRLQVSCFHSAARHRGKQQATKRRMCIARAKKIEVAGDITAKAVSETGKGRATYRPATYEEIVKDAATAMLRALEDGNTRMEVDFPSVSGDSYKIASDDYVDTNIQQAFSAARQIQKATGKRVHILVPDVGEYRRSYKMFKSVFQRSDGITLGNLGEGRKGTLNNIGNVLGGLFGGEPSPIAPDESAKSADMFFCVNSSTVELVDLEKYAEEIAGQKPLVIWNMELDTLRSDLGLFGFPSKDLQYRFLATFKPVFYIRQRDYSKTVSVAPYNLNYSGCLFREYPGPWQVMLRQNNGEYACVAERAERYALGEVKPFSCFIHDIIGMHFVKETLMESMGLNTEAEGSALAFLRRGYKRSTWWEDDKDKELSNAWRS